MKFTKRSSVYSIDEEVDLDLKGKNCIITGASRGIGKAIALNLAEQGARLCLMGRNKETLISVAEEAGRFPWNHHLAEVDLSKTSEIHSFCKEIPEKIGKVDVLILNAGMFMMGTHENITPEEFDLLYKTNLRAPYELIHWLLPYFNSNFSQIIFINSTVRAKGSYGQYAITKRALKDMADSLRDEVNQDNVRVTSIFAGRTNTEMAKEVFAQEGALDKYNPKLLLQPEDIAKMVAYALKMPLSAEVTDLYMRGFRKSY